MKLSPYFDRPDSNAEHWKPYKLVIFHNSIRNLLRCCHQVSDSVSKHYLLIFVVRIRAILGGLSPRWFSIEFRPAHLEDIFEDERNQHVCRKSEPGTTFAWFPSGNTL